MIEDNFRICIGSETLEGEVAFSHRREVEGLGVKFAGFESYDFFIARDNDRWKVYESTTGFWVAGSKDSPEEAYHRTHERLLEKKELFESAMDYARRFNDGGMTMPLSRIIESEKEDFHHVRGTQ